MNEETINTTRSNIKLLKMMILHRSRKSESSKHICYFENCYKEYGTKGALVFHIKHKHNGTDPVKKDYVSLSKNSRSNYSFTKILNDARSHSLAVKNQDDFNRKDATQENSQQ